MAAYTNPSSREVSITSTAGKSDAGHGSSVDVIPKKRRASNQANQTTGVPKTNGTDETNRFVRFRIDSKPKIPLSLKMIHKNRIASSKLINFPSYGTEIHMKEMKPALDKKIHIDSSFKPRPFKTRDRNLEDFKPKTSNPYDLPKLKRTFYHEKVKKHTKGKTDPFIMSEPRTICDIDEHFYKEIEGRPIRQFNDIKVYMENLRTITLWRTNAAFANEKILQIEHHHAYELDQYNKILRFYRRCKYNFVQFLKERYHDAKCIQDLADETSKELASVTDQLEQYSFKYVKLRNRVANMTFLFNSLSMYRRFLFSLSPATWRKKHDPFYNEDTDSYDTFTDLNDTEFDMPFVTSIEKFRKKLCPDEKPILYFTDPHQLTLVFDELRKQCVTYVEIDVVTSKLLKSVVKCRDQLKGKLASTIKDLKEWIFSIESEIIFLEEREIAYKEAFEKMIMSEFQKLYSSRENIKLFTCVQYVNVHLIGGPEEPKDSVVTLMCAVENLYYDLNLKLDDLNQGVVRAAKKEMFAEDNKMMKRAYKAQRILTESERLTKSLCASFEPPRNKMKNTISSKKKQTENERSK